MQWIQYGDNTGAPGREVKRRYEQIRPLSKQATSSARPRYRHDYTEAIIL